MGRKSVQADNAADTDRLKRENHALGIVSREQAFRKINTSPLGGHISRESFEAGWNAAADSLKKTRI